MKFDRGTYGKFVGCYGCWINMNIFFYYYYWHCVIEIMCIYTINDGVVIAMISANQYLFHYFLWECCVWFMPFWFTPSSSGMQLVSKLTTSCNGFEHHWLVTFSALCVLEWTVLSGVRMDQR